jgi:hypothetical protein
MWRLFGLVTIHEYLLSSNKLETIACRLCNGAVTAWHDSSNQAPDVRNRSARAFGGGCDVVHIDAPGAGAAIEAGIEKAWASAPDLRDALLRSADAQIHRAREAYRFIGGLVDAAPCHANVAQRWERVNDQSGRANA